MSQHFQARRELLLGARARRPHLERRGEELRRGTHVAQLRDADLVRVGLGLGTVRVRVPNPNPNPSPITLSNPTLTLTLTPVLRRSSGWSGSSARPSLGEDAHRRGLRVRVRDRDLELGL